MESYLFMECCGCGTTKIFLDIDNKNFTILHISHWMGYIGPMYFKYEGIINSMNSCDGFINSIQFMTRPEYIGSRQLYVGDKYIVPSKVLKVSFTRFPEKKLTDNSLMPDPGTIESHLGDGEINMGNCPNYNTLYQMKMKFDVSPHSSVKFSPNTWDYKDNEQSQLDAIDTMIHPNGQFLDKIINILNNINYVQMGQFIDDVYEEKAENGQICIKYHRSDILQEFQQMK